MKTITVSFGPTSSTRKEFPDNTTVRQVIENASVRAALGHTTNVQALDGRRRHLDLDTIITHGMEISLETVANQKATGGMGAGGEGEVTVTVSFGPTSSATKNVPAGTTIGQILGSASWKAAVGFGDNVKALIDRVQQDLNTVVQDGDTIELETVANEKAQ